MYGGDDRWSWYGQLTDSTAAQILAAGNSIGTLNIDRRFVNHKMLAHVFRSPEVCFRVIPTVVTATGDITIGGGTAVAALPALALRPLTDLCPYYSLVAL